MLKQFPSVLICLCNTEYLVEIGLVVLEIQKAEIGDFIVPVNNTLVYHVSFVSLVTNT